MNETRLLALDRTVPQFAPRPRPERRTGTLPATIPSPRGPSRSRKCLLESDRSSLVMVRALRKGRRRSTSDSGRRLAIIGRNDIVPRPADRGVPGVLFPVRNVLWSARMATDIKPGGTVRVTISKTPTRATARKTLERLFMGDRAIAGPIAVRSRNFKEMPKRRGGQIWTKR